jgi:hypothetical protein
MGEHFLQEAAAQLRPSYTIRFYSNTCGINASGKGRENCGNGEDGQYRIKQVSPKRSTKPTFQVLELGNSTILITSRSKHGTIFN